MYLYIHILSVAPYMVAPDLHYFEVIFPLHVIYLYLHVIYLYLHISSSIQYIYMIYNALCEYKGAEGDYLLFWGHQTGWPNE